jgi:DNA-binding transcriptional ArsR family regulator
MVEYRERALTAVFSALGDPTRRGILRKLRDGGEASVTSLAKPFPMSLVGVTKHLDSLQRAGLVGQRKRGRERLYWLLPEPLQVANQWLAEYESFWRLRLDSLGEYLREEPTRGT